MMNLRDKIGRTVTRSQHRAFGTWIFGSSLFVFFVLVFIYAPNPLPEYKQRMLAVSCALLAGLFTFFFVGDLNIDLTVSRTPFGRVAVKSAGSLTSIALILWWWSTPWAPRTSVSLLSSPTPASQPGPPTGVIPNRGLNPLGPTRPAPASERPDEDTRKNAVVSVKTPEVSPPPVAPRMPGPERRGRVLILITEIGDGRSQNESTISQAMSRRLTGNGLHVTLGSDLSGADQSRFAQAIQRLKARDQTAGSLVPFQVSITGKVTVSPRGLSAGLYLAEASGLLEAVDVVTGDTLVQEIVSSVKGFGQTPELAAGDSLKEAGDQLAGWFASEILAKLK
jgi:hypothetical protein